MCLDTSFFPVVVIFSLLVELMLLLVLFDDGLVSFFEVFGQDDIPVLTYCQHASLDKEEDSLKKKHK